MKNNMISASDYPPPPPPPETKKQSSKTLILGIVVILALVGVVGAYYVGTLPANPTDGVTPNVSPSPSVSTTPSSGLASPSSTAATTAKPTSTPIPTVAATPEPSGQASNGYRLGAWANYTTEYYNETGDVSAKYNLGYSVNEGIKNGIDCWILQTENELITDFGPMKTTTKYWLDKRDLQGVHYKIQISSNGIVISDTENDYAPGDVNDIPTAIVPNTIITQEAISVPAGTFNCDKAETTVIDLGKTYVTTVWGNSNIPIIGMVKQEMARDGFRISATSLVAYGG
jgi:hypothetical protein